MSTSGTERYRIEAEEKWREWINKIPFIKFPANWKIKPIPPFGGAMARFQVELPGKPKLTKSIYLDCFDNLGCHGSPYWEVHPYRGDCGRCDMDDTKKLLKMIADRKDEY